jgi:hypothetical protein
MLLNSVPQSPPRGSRERKERGGEGWCGRREVRESAGGKERKKRVPLKGRKRLICHTIRISKIWHFIETTLCQIVQ